MTHLATIATHLDILLGTETTPDYPGAFNGVQVANRSPIERVGAAVDLSRRVVESAADQGVNLLLVHHGMFWAGVQRIVGAFYERLRLLLEHDIAVYASHLPLDAHPDLGNNVLVARALGLEPTAGFAHYQTIDVGVRGEVDIDTSELVRRADSLAREYGGAVRATPFPLGRRTTRWGICTGAGASSETLREAGTAGLDTLIVGEGPHHTAVDAEEAGLVVIYAGHYATETLGVRALADHVGHTFGLPSVFIHAPTGL